MDSDTMNQFDTVVGMQYLRGMHLNDSKAVLGSKKDRHDNLGRCVLLPCTQTFTAEEALSSDAQG